MECCFCKKTYKNEYILANHKKTTKKCLQLQASSQIVKDVHACTFCKKELSTKNRLVTHLLICKKKSNEDAIKHVSKQVSSLRDDLEDKIEQATFELRTKHEEERYELRLKIKELEEQVNGKKGKTVTTIETNIEQQTNHITIYNVMSPEHVSDFFKQHYKLDTLLGGQKAFARFVHDGFLKEAPVYLCGDRSRQKFYIVADGKKMEDTDCNEILGLTSPGMPHVQEVYENALFSKPEEVTEDEVQDNFQQIMTMEENRADFKSELSKVVSSTMPSHDFNRVIRSINEDCKKRGLYERETKTEEPVALVKRPDVLGYTRGRLMIYRDKYRNEGVIKGPPDLMERIEHDKDARNEYLAYLRESA